MVTVVSVDEDGNPVPAPVRTNVQSYLDAMREINFIVNVMDATTAAVDVTANITVLDGYDPGDTISRVQQSLSNYLDPATWGVEPTDNPADPKTWDNVAMVYYLEVSTVINNVGGVDRVTDLRIGANGGPQYAADLALPGVVPLPHPGSLVVTYTA
jgi:hypothetical protein